MTDMLNCKLKRIQKDAIVTEFLFVPGGAEKIHGSISEITRCPGQDS
jgi:hypothetical protein